MISDTAILRNPNYHPGGPARDLDYPKMAYVIEGVANFLLAY